MVLSGPIPNRTKAKTAIIAMAMGFLYHELSAKDVSWPNCPEARLFIPENGLNLETAPANPLRLLGLALLEVSPELRLAIFGPEGGGDLNAGILSALRTASCTSSLPAFLIAIFVGTATFLTVVPAMC